MGLKNKDTATGEYANPLLVKELTRLTESGMSVFEAAPLARQNLEEKGIGLKVDEEKADRMVYAIKEKEKEIEEAKGSLSRPPSPVQEASASGYYEEEYDDYEPVPDPDGGDLIMGLPRQQAYLIGGLLILMALYYFTTKKQ